MGQGQMMNNMMGMTNQMSEMMGKMSNMMKDMPAGNTKQMSELMKEMSRQMMDMSKMTGKSTVSEKEMKGLQDRMMQMQKKMSELEMKK